jgi:hypothetical protein
VTPFSRYLKQIEELKIAPRAGGFIRKMGELSINVKMR